ncbi:fimbrial protein [Luteibacter sp. 3190]|uniref:fimbrial protein n=1 Tax=Luteibacter sp. 3190 TaxID=2817736 RepID=UPI0028599E53|nr:fimbrial protein [Luteibacter sp. 3190]MDR6937659.1 type 1 fimbria pilin [Luteibacter sp. 3190]
MQGIIRKVIAAGAMCLLGTTHASVVMNGTRYVYGERSMMTKNGKRTTLTLLALVSIGGAVEARANGGCTSVNEATYQIGQTTYIDVHNAMEVGDVVQRGGAYGEGKVLLSCEEGLAHFRGFYVKPTVGDLVPLLVNSKPSGFGIRVKIQENGQSVIRSFPHEFDESFAKGEEVTSADDTVSYEVERMAGPVLFGRVDSGEIAKQAVSLPNISAQQVFRTMEIFSMILRRPTCTITPETLDQTVKLGDYNLSNFATPDRATPWVPFKLTVEKCPEPLGMVARFTFGGAGDADADNPDLFRLTGPENVGLELGDANKKTMRPGQLIRMNALGPGEDYEFYARLRETKPTVRGGIVNRDVTVLVDFER